jgi:hypothetical protein
MATLTVPLLSLSVVSGQTLPASQQPPPPDARGAALIREAVETTTTTAPPATLRFINRDIVVLRGTFLTRTPAMRVLGAERTRRNDRGLRFPQLLRHLRFGWRHS